MHTSIAGGLWRALERAHALGCTTLQIFSHNPRGWALADIPEEEARRFRRLREKLGLDPVFIHASYLINPASAEAALRERSIRMLSEELRRADMLGADFVIVHAGPRGDSDDGQLIRSLRKVLPEGRKKFRAGLLLENAASREPASIATLAKAVQDSGAAGLCLDTCHAFVSGYDIRATAVLKGLALQTEGIKVHLIHLNDSKGQVGSGLDRHEHLGKGRIGIDGLARLVRFGSFRGLPLILETPKKFPGDDPMNLAAAKTLLSR